VKALTVSEPYASAIVDGAKPEEYRSWSPSYRGPLLIHAGKSRARFRQAPPLGEHVFGVIIGLVDLIYVRQDRDSYAWILANPRRFERPIPHMGKLGLWEVPDELVWLGVAGPKG
jgi:hypothetical protein